MMWLLMIVVAITYGVIIHPGVETAGPLILERSQVHMLLGFRSHAHRCINTSLCFMDLHFKKVGTEKKKALLVGKEGVG